MKAKLLFFLFLYLFSFNIFAEYRVFKLQFVNAKTNQIRQIQSTLDPEQYKNLYPLAQGEKLTYVQTWRCPGSTSHFKAHCLGPELKP